MNRLDAAIASLRARGEKLFIPFLTAGDPDLATTALLVRELTARGASLVELGVPYSDPIADGPVIQASYTRALARGTRLAQILATAETLAPAAAPLVAMVSYAIVFRTGPERFIQEAKRSGIEGAIVPDLPVDEAEPLAEIAGRHRFCLIQLVTPTTPRDRAVRIARSSTGFIYFVSVTGITGERSRVPDGVLEQVAWLKRQTDLPICIGFGISRPEHVRMLAPVADGVIVGSAIVRRVAESAGRPPADLAREVGAYVATLIDALHAGGDEAAAGR